MNDEFDYNNAMASLYPDTEYVINKSAYDCGVEGVKEEIVRCRDCEMCKEQEIYDENGNVERVEFQCSRPIMFLENAGVSKQPMHIGSLSNYMNIVLQNVDLDGFCAWGKRKRNELSSND